MRSPWFYVFGFLIIGAVTALALALRPEWRVRIQGSLLGEQKVLLASVSGVVGNMSNLKVLKFKTRQGIVIEVHSQTESEDLPYVLVDKVVIPDRHDGYFQLSGQATQLALVDVDQDGRPDIVAPTYDDKLVAHLNAFRLDPDSNKLQLIRPERDE